MIRRRSGNEPTEGMVGIDFSGKKKVSGRTRAKSNRRATVVVEAGGSQVRTAQAMHARVGKLALATVGALLLASVWALFYSAPAAAQVDPYSSESPSVLPTRIDREPEGEVGGDAQERGPDEVSPSADEGVLPFTGGDVVLFAVIGAAAAGTGFVLVRRTRRQDN